MHIYDVIMHDRGQVHYCTYMCRTMILLIYHIFVHVGSLHCEIFHVESWVYRLLIDKNNLFIQNSGTIIPPQYPTLYSKRGNQGVRMV